MTIMITRENYEIYIIDYLDGQLSEGMQKQLLHFLNQNPDLKAEFEMMQDTSLPASDEVFEDKASLKKNLEEEPVTDDNIDEWCIAAMEDDLSENGKQKFAETITKQPSYKKIYTEYLKTRLEKEHIDFPGFKPWQLPNFEAEPDLQDADYWVIAAMENDLSSAQLQQWKEAKQEISGINDLEQVYQKIRLQPEVVEYPDKQALKKRKNRTRYLYPLSGIAAAAAIFYLFISIADISDDTYKKYNQKMAQMEQEVTEGRFPKPSIINLPMKEQMIRTIEYFAANQNKPSEGSQKAVQKQTIEKPVRHSSPVELVEYRQMAVSQPDIESIDRSLKTEIIRADELINDAYAQNQVGMQLSQRNKLTFYKVAKKGMEVVNNKVGTKMDLDARYDKQGKKKKIRFSTRLFSITKTVNK